MADCIFCDIAGKKIPATIVFEDGDVVAFEDIHPNAPVHFLIIPKQHHATLEALSDPDLMNHLLTVAKQLGAERSADLGYRIMINSGKQAEVDHLHVHLLGGLRPEEPLQAQGGDGA